MKPRLLILGSLLLYGVALVFELLFLRPFLNVDFSQVFPYLYFHILASFLFALAATLWFKFYVHLFSFFILSSFCWSLFALLGIPLFLFIRFLLSHFSKSMFQEPPENDEDMSLLLELLPPEKLSEDILESVHGRLEIEPYIDILKGYDDELKKGALEQLAKIKNKEAVQLIQMALEDSNPEIRYTASIKLKKIEDELSEQISIVKEKLKREQTKENHNHLGDAYSQFCRMALLDSATQDHYYKLALQEYILSLQIDPKQSLILKSLAENYFAIHRPDQALSILHRALNLDPENSELYLMRCEAKAQLGEWEGISSDCQKIQALKKNDVDYVFNFKGLCEYWI